MLKKDVYNAKTKNIEDKIPDITNLTTKATLNAKINEVKGEIPNITNLAIKAALTTAEIKIPSVTNLVKKTDYNTKNSETEKKITDYRHDKCITTPEVTKFTAEILDLRLKGANLASKSDIANLIKRTDFDNKLKDVTLKKNELNELLKKVKVISIKGLTKDLKDLIDKFSILNGEKYFSSGIFQNCLVFIPAKKGIKYFHATTRIYS